MKKYRLTLTEKELQKIHDLLKEEFGALFNAHAAQSSVDFVGKILDDCFMKLNP